MKQRCGLTLIELVLAVALITIISAGFFITTRSDDRRTLYNASVALQADLRYAQRRAITEGRRHSVVFDAINQRYHILLHGTPGPIRTTYLPPGVTFQTVTAQQSRVIFLPRGTISGGFTVVLANQSYSRSLTGTVSGGRIELFPIVQN